MTHDVEFERWASTARNVSKDSRRDVVIEAAPPGLRLAATFRVMGSTLRGRLTVYLETVQIGAGKALEEADLGRLIGILRSANYRGYVALEYEAKEDPKTAVPKATAALRKLMG